MTATVVLLAFFALKHWLADWLFQSGSFAWISSGKRARGFKWLAPLALHAGIHVGMTGSIIVWAALLLQRVSLIDSVWLVVSSEFIVYATMDRIKAVATRPRTESRMAFGHTVSWTTPVSDCQQKVWLVLDQSVHVATYLGIVYYLAG